MYELKYMRVQITQNYSQFSIRFRPHPQMILQLAFPCSLLTLHNS